MAAAPFLGSVLERATEESFGDCREKCLVLPISVLPVRGMRDYGVGIAAETSFEGGLSTLFESTALTM